MEPHLKVEDLTKAAKKEFLNRAIKHKRSCEMCFLPIEKANSGMWGVYNFGRQVLCPKHRMEHEECL